MKAASILTSVQPNGVATIKLNRPGVHNALDDVMIADFTQAVRGLGEDAGVRIVVLKGEGKSFCAGADLNWMRRTADYSDQENRRDALALAELMRTLDELSKPTIACIQGAALGGGVGLVVCADIAVAAEEAEFSLSEVRLGLIPAVISPYVIRAMGPRQARRLFLTGERFSASEAHRLGLIQEVVPLAELDQKTEEVSAKLLQAGPRAQSAAKALIADVAFRPIDDSLMRYTAERIAAVRASGEGREGVSAFLEKRAPPWRV